MNHLCIGSVRSLSKESTIRSKIALKQASNSYITVKPDNHMNEKMTYSAFLPRLNEPILDPRHDRETLQKHLIGESSSDKVAHFTDTWLLVYGDLAAK